MSGEPVVIVTDDGETGAEFAAGVATATAEQAAETAERAELTAELALDVAQQAAVVAEQEVEDDMSQADFDAFKAETQGTLAAILERLDERDVTAEPEEETAGPPAPAPKDNEGQEDAAATPEADDVADDKPKPKPPTDDDDDGPSYGARSWFGGKKR